MLQQKKREEKSGPLICVTNGKSSSWPAQPVVVAVALTLTRIIKSVVTRTDSSYSEVEEYPSPWPAQPVVVAVALTLTRIIKPVVKGQAPATLKRKNTQVRII